MAILDHTQDLSGVETHRLTSLYPPPDFVKAASHAQLYGDGEQALPAHLYAAPRSRLYPCHTKAATWMSCLFFMDKHAELPPDTVRQVGAAIEKQARYFDIRHELDDLKTKMAADEGDELARLPDAQWALIWQNEDGSKERHYSMRNPGEVKFAADWFVKWRDEFAFPDRHVMAHKILDRADALGLDTGHTELLQKTAGMGYCAADTAAALLEKRANLVAREDPNAAAQMRNVAQAVRQNPPTVRDVGLRVKLAGLVDQYDRVMHLNRLYDEGGLERPEDVLFQVTEKVAKEFLAQHVQLISGTVYEKSALEQLPLQTLRDWLGTLADEVTSGGLFMDMDKLAAIAATLPRGDAETFDRMCQAASIPIFVREKAAQARGPSLGELAALAEQYQPQPPEHSLL